MKVCTDHGNDVHLHSRAAGFRCKSPPFLSYLVFYGNVGRKRLAAKAAAKERGSAAPLSNCPTPVPRQMSRNDDRRTDEVKTYIGRGARPGTGKPQSRTTTGTRRWRRRRRRRRPRAYFACFDCGGRRERQQQKKKRCKSAISDLATTCTTVHNLQSKFLSNQFRYSRIAPPQTDSAARVSRNLLSIELPCKVSICSPCC